VDLEKPITTSCGSGVSAAVATLALARLGRFDVALYDGSWTEWGSQPDTPVAR
jgi:thiosulfate/3-mercaptopyruvate sulfurtransferase